MEKIKSEFHDGSQTAKVKIDDQEFRFAIDFREDFEVVNRIIWAAYHQGLEDSKEQPEN